MELNKQTIYFEGYGMVFS